MTKLITVLVPAAALLGYAATSLAGAKGDQVPDVAYAFGTTAANATGSMAAARAGTTDNFAKIGCWAVGNTTGITVACLATDPNNFSLSCSSTAPALVQTIQAVNPASHIAFTVGPDGSTCDNVVIDDGSFYGLKK